MFTRRARPVGDTALGDGDDGRVLTPARLSCDIALEGWRAQRYGRHLVIVAVVPQLLPGDEIGQAELNTATGAVVSRLRRTDRVGLTTDRAIVCLLPETEERGGRSAGHRLAAQLMLSSRAATQRNWLYGVAEHREEVLAEDLIASALADARGR